MSFQCHRCTWWAVVTEPREPGREYESYSVHPWCCRWSMSGLHPSGMMLRPNQLSRLDSLTTGGCHCQWLRFGSEHSTLCPDQNEKHGNLYNELQAQCKLAFTKQVGTASFYQWRTVWKWNQYYLKYTVALCSPNHGHISCKWYSLMFGEYLFKCFSPLLTFVTT